MDGVNRGPTPQNSQPTPVRRLPTVDEAITYTPITSIVPFNADVMPAPSLAFSQLPTLPLTAEESQSARRQLNELNFEASHPNSTSARLEQTLKDLQLLLQPESLTRVQLKKAPMPSAVSAPTSEMHREPHAKERQLGPFAKMVFNNIEIPYSYSSQSFPSRAVATHQNGNRSFATSTPVVPILQTPAAQNARSFQQNARHHDNTHRAHASIPSPSQQHKPTSGPAVLIQKSSFTSERAQYASYPHIDAAIIDAVEEQAKPRTASHNQDHLQNTRLGQDQKSDAALAELNSLTSAILEAEDQIGNEDQLNAHEEDRFFVSAHSEADSDVKMILSNRSLANLDSVLIKVNNCRSMHRFPVDTLVQLQKICVRAVSLASDLDLSVPASSDTDALTPWAERADAVENSLRASGVILRIMTGDRDDQQLQSEEILVEVLSCLRRVVENALIPIVEAVAGTYNHLERSHEAILGSILQRCGRIFRLLGQLIAKYDTSESIVTATEFLAAKLVFVENVSSEKNSVLGVSKFESFRRYAMDALTRIFKRCPSQRRFIFDEILSSLEKLPVTRQSARQYKVAESKPIQLVSALVMQLIQASVSQNEMAVTKLPKIESEEDAEGSEDSDYSDGSVANGKQKHRSSPGKPTGNDLVDLKNMALPLFETAQQNAVYFSSYLVKRAMTTSKNEQPYRNLLDLFTEDFVSVLGSMDWPAAELLLRALLSSLLSVAQGDKSTAPAKVMALDLMGVMGSAIADLQGYLHRSIPALDSSESFLSKTLKQMAEDSAEGNLNEADLLRSLGPYRAVLSALDRKISNDHSLQSVRDYILIQWARSIVTLCESIAGQDEAYQIPEQLYGSMKWLNKAISASADTIDDDEFSGISITESRVAYTICVLYTPFSKALRSIFNVLLTSMSSNHATVRSRSLKSVTQLLEKDPAILDRYPNVLSSIIHVATDSSPLVRDSALGLIGKCALMKPHIEAEVYPHIILRSQDPATIVRKRAMKLLKETYLRIKSKEVRCHVAEAILQRADDVEASVAELARTIIEEVWFAPYYDLCASTVISKETSRRLEDHAAHIVATAHLNETVVDVLTTMFQALLAPLSKNASSNSNVCRHLIHVIFESWISDTSTESSVQPPQYLETLTIFAKARPDLFEASQMKPLQPYINHIEASDDPLVYRSVIVIYRCVLPLLPSIEKGFAQQVQEVLLKNLQKLRKQELEEVSTCLSILDGVLKNTTRLVRLVLSVVDNLRQLSQPTIATDEKLMSRARRLLTIAGYLGKSLDLEDHQAIFKQKIPTFKGSSVAGYIIDVLCQFAEGHIPDSVRQFALDAICLVAQSWPANFRKPRVVAGLGSALESKDEKMKLSVLLGIKTYFLLEEQRSKSALEIPLGAGTTAGAERLSKSMLSSDREGATNTLAQQFLAHFQEISLASTDQVALVATEVIASITRQGITHPRECCVTLVALETSPNSRIAQIAFEQHRLVHEKHESLLEKDNLRAIENAYQYQRTVVHDVRGFVVATQAPKLQMFYEVIKMGTSSIRRKLFHNLCSRLDFNGTKLPEVSQLATSIDYARFVLENLALLEYARIDEILQVIATIEKVFSTTGNVLAQRIEGALNLSMRPLDNSIPPENGETNGLPHPTNGFTDHEANGISAEPDLLRLALSATNLTLMWETRSYLRRLWSLSVSVTAKMANKDTARAPTKSSSTSAEPLPYLDKMENLASGVQTADESALRRICQTFTELISIDNEFKAAASDDDGGTNSRSGTPLGFDDDDDDDDASIMASGGTNGTLRGKKRKTMSGVGSLAGTPSKARKRGRPPLDRRKSSSVSRSFGRPGSYDGAADIDGFAD